jgi:proteasome lid subunit RPN8/RPN11
MIRHTLTIQHRHEEELRSLVLREDGKEGMAYLLCTHAKIDRDPWTGTPELRFISREVVSVDATDILEHSENHITFRPETLHKLLPYCQRNRLFVVLVHSHPPQVPDPSQQDDKNERVLFDYGWVRDGDDIPFGSIVLTNTTIRGRVWYGWSPAPFQFDVIRCIGKDFIFHRLDVSSHRRSSIFHRQILAFGKALDDELASLRVVIVGAGGTGSATAMMLARLGIGRIAILDPDIVEATNLNRLHTARQADADYGRSKAQVVSSTIAEMGLGVSVRGFVNYVDDPSVRDILRSADIIFGCTDDHSGRLFLNRLAYYYCIPVIDMGLLIEVAENNGTPKLKHLTGRVTTLAPGTSCIACRGVTDAEIAREEVLRRKEPGNYAKLKAEAYVRGEGNPSPAVVTFTTATATMAVNEMLHRLNHFRILSSDHRLHDFLDGSEIALASSHRAGCKFCDTMQYCGRGDTPSFLDYQS